MSWNSRTWDWNAWIVSGIQDWKSLKHNWRSEEEKKDLESNLDLKIVQIKMNLPSCPENYLIEYPNIPGFKVN